MELNALLFTNELFYHAFSSRDFNAMQSLWARSVPVYCVHPGWPALTEYAAILESWRRILSNPNSSVVTPHHARGLIYGDVATVVCYEEVGGALLLASNTFTKENGEIRIAQHHASHCANPPPPEEKTPPPLQ